MAYAIYTTEAFVCGTFNRNTADRSFLLFTREAGMLTASARSVREERSKQRYALQDFSLVRVSLVRGKTGWRIGSVQAQKNYYHDATDKAARGSVVGIFRLLRRFVGGEEAHAELFEYARSALEAVVIDVTERPFVQLVVYVNILAYLGYVDRAKVPAEIQGPVWNTLGAEQSDTLSSQVEKLYTHAVTVSHL